ncbi:hypothetical protein ACFYST_16440 [Kitasatospora sp. NPDC004614]|uniref:hypothetical protein n=1 Tax=unclassified Kitasatospora TaxID=2633591 RepID=UPI00367BBC84
MNEKTGTGRPWRGSLHALLTLLCCAAPIGVLTYLFGGSEAVELLHAVTPTALILVVALNYRTPRGGVAAFVAGGLALWLSFAGMAAVRTGSLADHGQQITVTVTAVHPRNGTHLPTCEVSRPDGTAVRHPLDACNLHVGRQLTVTADPSDRQAPIWEPLDADTPLHWTAGVGTALVALLVSLPFWAGRRRQRPGGPSEPVAAGGPADWRV